MPAHTAGIPRQLPSGSSLPCRVTLIFQLQDLRDLEGRGCNRLRADGLIRVRLGIRLGRYSAWSAHNFRSNRVDLLLDMRGEKGLISSHLIDNSGLSFKRVVTIRCAEAALHFSWNSADIAFCVVLILGLSKGCGFKQ
jgi:hypothetical protein